MNVKQHIEKFVGFYLVLICCFSLFMHREHINKDIQGSHLWRQSQTMLNIRNFIRQDGNILNPRVAKFNSGDNIYRYEFPLMQWSIAMIQRVTGEKILIVRLMMFLFSCIGTLGLYFLINKITREKIVALLTATLFQFSPVIFQYAINPIPDVLAFSCSIWYLYFILEHRDSRKQVDLFLAGMMLCLASLIKLPYLMFSIVSILFFFQKLAQDRKWSQVLTKYVLVQFLLIIPVVLWYAWVIPEWEGNPIVAGVFSDSVEWTETKKYLLFHVQDMFPMRILHIILWPLFIVGIVGFVISTIRKDWIYALIVITFVYLSYEFYAIADMHDYYMFPFVLWIFIFVAMGVHTILKTKYKWLSYLFIPYVILLGINTEATIQHSWSKVNSQVNTDFYTYQAALQQAVPPDEKVIILNDFTYFMIPYIIDKQGNIFCKDDLPIPFIDDMIRRQGFQYMYSDSEKINTNPAFQPYINKILLEANTIKVYSLKLPD